MNKIKLLFETKMYLISLTPFIFMLKPNGKGVYGINKTVGWAYDLSGFSVFIFYFLLAFLLGFSFLAIFKAKTNLILSFLFFLGISYCCLFQNGYLNIDLIDKFLLISTFLFLLIFINSIYLKFKSPK